jgi:hypothetical protein
MPPLKDMVRASLPGFAPAENSMPPIPVSQQEGGEKPNQYIRCPLPPFNIDPDTLRQFDERGKTPTRRVIPLPQQQSGGSGTTTINQNTTVIQQGGSGGSGSGGGTSGLSVATVAFNVPTLAPGATFMITISMAKSFQLLQLATSQPCEVRLYGTNVAQVVDIARSTDEPVPYEVFPGIITDVVLDSPPYQWSWQNQVGRNADAVTGTSIYATVVNPSSGGIGPGVVTVTYLPMEV